MVSDLASVEPREERWLGVEARDPERLLHKFLSEVVYYKDAEQRYRTLKAEAGRARTPVPTE